MVEVKRMFQVGDKVICVDDIFDKIGDPRKGSLMENKIYIIKDVDPNWQYQDYTPAQGCGVTLVGISILAPDGDEYGFEIQRFRKLEPPKEEITELETELAVSQ